MKKNYLLALFAFGIMLGFSSCSNQTLEEEVVEKKEKMYSVDYVNPDGTPFEFPADTKASWSGTHTSYPYMTSVSADASTWCTTAKDWVKLSGGDDGAKTLRSGDSYNITKKITQDYTIKVETGSDVASYTVTVKAGDGGTATGGGTVDEGKSVSISASPNNSYTFAGWTVASGSGTFGNASSTSTTFTPSTNSTVTANFITAEKKKYSISIIESPEEFSYLGSGPWYYSPQTNRDGSGYIEENKPFSITLNTPVCNENGISVRVASATCNGKPFNGSYNIPSVKNDISISIKYEYYETSSGVTVPSPME